MIKRIKELMEKYFTTVTTGGYLAKGYGDRDVDIYKNPTTKELMDSMDDSTSRQAVRFIVAENGDIYIWNWHKAIHRDIQAKLNIPKAVGGIFSVTEDKLISFDGGNISINKENGFTEDEMLDIFLKSSLARMYGLTRENANTRFYSYNESVSRIQELVGYIKSDVSPRGLDYVFPEVQNVFYLDTKGDTDFAYIRIDDNTFHVAKSLYKRNEPDFEAELSTQDLLDTIKKSANDYDIKIQKTHKGYDVVLVELEDEVDEEWAGAVKTSWKKNDIIDVFKNPSRGEILKMTQGGKTPVRFFIALSGDYYVWAFDDAEHDEVARQLKQNFKVKGVYYNPKYIEFFKVKTPESVYPEVEHSRMMNVLDPDFNDNLLRRKHD